MRESFTAIWVLIVMLGASVVAVTGDRPIRQQAIAYLSEPTLIGSTVVQGPLVFIHDEARMARGEPCTTVHLFEPGKGSMEEIASFHCSPVRRPLADKFTVRTRPNSALGFGCVLLEYQFAGDTEGHGVPLPANAH